MARQKAAQMLGGNTLLDSVGLLTGTAHTMFNITDPMKAMTKSKYCFDVLSVLSSNVSLMGSSSFHQTNGFHQVWLEANHGALCCKDKTLPPSVRTRHFLEPLFLPQSTWHACLHAALHHHAQHISINEGCDNVRECAVHQALSVTAVEQCSSRET
jgi:hypothetical protein